MSERSGAMALPPTAEIAMLRLQLRAARRELDEIEKAPDEPRVTTEQAVAQLQARLLPMVDERRRQYAIELEAAQAEAQARIDVERRALTAVPAPWPPSPPMVEPPALADAEHLDAETGDAETGDAETGDTLNADAELVAWNSDVTPTEAEDADETVAAPPATIAGAAAVAAGVDGTWSDPLAGGTGCDAPRIDDTGADEDDDSPRINGVAAMAGIPVVAAATLATSDDAEHDTDDVDAPDMASTPPGPATPDTASSVPGPADTPEPPSFAAPPLPADVSVGSQDGPDLSDDADPDADASPWSRSTPSTAETDADFEARVQAEVERRIGSNSAPAPQAGFDPTAIATAIAAAVAAVNADRPVASSRSADEARWESAGPRPSYHMQPAPKRSFWADTWHADVLLSLIALVIVVVVLIAWAS